MIEAYGDERAIFSVNCFLCKMSCGSAYFITGFLLPLYMPAERAAVAVWFYKENPFGYVLLRD